jgi:hypothetical protein
MTEKPNHAAWPPTSAAGHPRRLRRRDEHLGPLGATLTEPNNLHTLRAVIEMPAQRAESAMGLST